MKQFITTFVLLFVLSDGFALANRPIVPNPEPEQMTLGQAFERLIVYKEGQNRQPVRFIERSVYKAGLNGKESAKLTNLLVKLLKNPKATLRAKQLACRWICLVDDTSALQTLASMLEKHDTFEMALGSLEKYQSHTANLILLNALNRSKGHRQIALMNTLGRRGDDSAVAKLSTLLLSNDKEVSKAAAINLGLIGGEKTARLLMQTDTVAKEVRHDAILRCAMRLRQEQKNKEAVEIYRYLWRQKSPAGLIGLVGVQKDDAGKELTKAFKSGDPLLSKTAVNLAGTLSDSTIDNELIGLLPDVSPELKIALIRMFSDNSKTSARKAITERLNDSQDEVVLAAIQALGQLGDTSSIEPLVNIASTKSGSIAKSARQSLILLAAPDVNSTIKKMIRSGDPSLRAELIQTAIVRKVPLQSSDLWKIINNTSETGDARRQALIALASTSAPDTYDKLIEFWSKLEDMSLSQTVKMAVTQLGMQLDENTRSKPLLNVMRKKLNPKIMGQMLSVAGHFDHPDFIGIMNASLQDSNPDIQLEAARALVSWPDTKGIDELTKVAASSDTTQRILAQTALLARSESKQLSVSQKNSILKFLAASDAPNNIKKRAVSLLGQLKQQLPEYRIEQISELAPEGFRLAAYLNCGTDNVTGGGKELKIKLIQGQKFQWEDSEKKYPPTAGTVFFGDKEVVFEMTGLRADRSYQLGFLWVDYDHGKRVQKVQIDNRTVVPATKLPFVYSKDNPLKNVTVPIPMELTADGKCVTRFKKLAAVNAVVSEIWLYESPEADNKMSNSAKKILLITGEDHRGHKWELTTPVLHSLLEKNNDLRVEVLDDLSKLSDENLKLYDALVMHFKNYDPKVPGRTGFDNITNFVKDGGGLVLVHFACGAFQEFKDEFTMLAGRAWNPKLRGHDPHGKFTVNITDRQHAITKGLNDFETTDELYTCLEGDTEITVLADAVSKVDKKTYPMAFVLNYGRGRVFHCVLGHDAVAFQPELVGRLFRQGTSWAAN